MTSVLVWELTLLWEKKLRPGMPASLKQIISILSLIEQRVSLKVGRVDVTLTKWSGVHKINEN